MVCDLQGKHLARPHLGRNRGAVTVHPAKIGQRKGRVIQSGDVRPERIGVHTVPRLARNHVLDSNHVRQRPRALRNRIDRVAAVAPQLREPARKLPPVPERVVDILTYKHRLDAISLEPQLADFVFSIACPLPRIELVDDPVDIRVRDPLLEAAAELRRVGKGQHPEAHAAGREHAAPAHVLLEPTCGPVLRRAPYVHGTAHPVRRGAVSRRLPGAKHHERAHDRGLAEIVQTSHGLPRREYGRQHQGHLELEMKALRLRHERHAEPIGRQHNRPDDPRKEHGEAKDQRRLQAFEPEPRQRRGKQQESETGQVPARCRVQSSAVLRVGVNGRESRRRNPGHREYVGIEGGAGGHQPASPRPKCEQVRQGRGGQRECAQPVGQRDRARRHRREYEAACAPFPDRKVKQDDRNRQQSQGGQVRHFSVLDQRLHAARLKHATRVPPDRLDQKRARRKQRIQPARHEARRERTRKPPRHPEQRHRAETVERGR